MGFEGNLLYVAVTAGAVAIVVFTVYLMRGRKKPAEVIVPKPSSEPTTVKLAFKTGRSVSPDEAEKARERLRLLELEREVLSDAIRKLYEAQAEGKITEQERDTLAERYKSRMLKIKDAISKRQSVVALHELEAMREDLIKLFNDRFDELNIKIDQLRPQIETTLPKEEITIPTIETPQIEEARATEAAETLETPAEQKLAKKPKPRPKPAPAAPAKTEAEKRIDQIRAEVEKVLDRLGQMESET